MRAGLNVYFRQNKVLAQITSGLFYFVNIAS